MNGMRNPATEVAMFFRTGTPISRHNPVEHRPFNIVGRNWTGKPLASLQSVLGFMAPINFPTDLVVPRAAGRPKT